VLRWCCDWCCGGGVSGVGCVAGVVMGEWDGTGVAGVAGMVRGIGMAPVWHRCCDF